jgi:hypothetical protein
MEKKDNTPRGPERRKNDERRRVHTDPSELPFPDRRRLERRNEDRRVVTEEEKNEILKKIEKEE